MFEQDERKFQIELATIEMKYRTTIVTFFAVIALEFILLGVINGFAAAISSPWLLLISVSILMIGIFTIFYSFWDLQDIEKEARALKEKYTWQ